MMGPLAGAGDPLFWFTLRPIFLSLGAGLAVSGNVLGPIVFFVLWNVMVAAVNGIPKNSVTVLVLRSQTTYLVTFFNK